MARQFDMDPEAVQQIAKKLTDTDIQQIYQTISSLEASLESLEGWDSNEKVVHEAAIRDDIQNLKRILVCANSYGTTARDIANKRIERENEAARRVNNWR